MSELDQLRSSLPRLKAPWRFSDLLLPLAPSEFAAATFGRRAVHIRHDPAFFSDLIDIGEIERFLDAEGFLEQQTVRLRRRGYDEAEPPRTAADLLGGLAAGKSIQLRKMERFLDPVHPVSALVADMEREIQHPKDSISCYLSPAGAGGLGPHLDETEIFTLQISGKKRWRLFDRIASDRPQIFRPDELSAPRHELILEPGDVLYHPRGMIHDVGSLGEPAFSITIVFRPVTWQALLQSVVAEVGGRPPFVDQLPAGVIFSGPRETLRAGFQERRRLLAEAVAALPFDAFLEQLDRSARPSARRPQKGLLERAERLAALSVGTLLTRATERHVRSIGATLIVDDAEIAVPPAAQPALAFALAAERPVLVLELPGLTPTDQLVLARLLVEHGVFEC